MKKHLSLFLSSHLQAASQSLNTLCYKPLGTFFTILVIAAVLTLPCLFAMAIDNAKKNLQYWEYSRQISLYLQPKFVDVKPLMEKISKLETISELKLITPSQGLEELRQQEGMQDALGSLSDNPLPTVINVTPASAVKTPFQLEALLQTLKNFPEIEQIQLDMKWLSSLHHALKIFSHFVQMILILLGFVIFLIIGNTLRLAIAHRQEEIQVLKLIGAQDNYIARPFLYVGIWYSLAGALIAIVLINGLIYGLSTALKPLSIMYKMHYSILGLTVKQAYVLTIGAVLVGWISAKLSVNSQLASIEPYN